MNKYMDFWSARDYIRKFNFKNRNEFRKFISLNTINIPSNPNYMVDNILNLLNILVVWTLLIH